MARRGSYARAARDLGVDETTVARRVARAEAALQGASKVEPKRLIRVAPSALRHRLRRNPLDDSGSSTRVERALAELTAPKP